MKLLLDDVIITHALNSDEHWWEMTVCEDGGHGKLLSFSKLNAIDVTNINIMILLHTDTV